MNPAGLTARDMALIDALTLRIRALSVEQIARTWFCNSQDPRRSALRRIATLARVGAVERLEAHARPELSLTQATAVWMPDKPAPDFEALSYQLARRWRQPAVPVSVVIATREAGAWNGGYGGRRPRRSEFSHDLSLAGVYLNWLQRDSHGTARWISEATLRKHGFGERGILPDAMVEERGRRHIVELGGVYGAVKLREFHRFCATRELAYEIW